MDVTLEWKGKMLFEGTAASGFKQLMDTDTSIGGDNSAGRPMEFIAMGLAGCTAMDVISVLRKKKQHVLDFKVTFHGERVTQPPRVFTKAIIEYLITGREVDEVAVRRAIELSVEKYCPAYAMLKKAFPIETRYIIYDERGNKKRKGVYEQAIAG